MQEFLQALSIIADECSMELIDAAVQLGADAARLQGTSRCPLPLRIALPVAYRALPIAHRAFPIACRASPIAHCPLPTAHCPLRTGHGFTKAP